MALLLEAILNGATSARIKNLIDNGASVNIPTTQYPLDAAVDRNNARIVQMILKRVDYDINKTSDGSDNNLLHRACSHVPTRVRIVRSLLQHGVNVNYVDQIGTALHRACQNGYENVVQLLIDYGANVNCCRNRNGETPLSYAIIHQYELIVDLLLQNGAQIYTTTFGFSIFSDAMGTRAEKLLIRHAANFNSRTICMWSDLSSAILDNRQLAKVLIALGDVHDMLCLYAAVVCGSGEILELIWDKIAPELVSNDLHFMVYVFESCRVGEIDKLYLLLKREDVDLHLDRCGKAFAYFICRTAIYASVSINDCYVLMTCLVTRGLRLSTSDAEIIISRLFGHYPFLAQNIINIALPKISLKALVDSTQSRSDEQLIQYCLEANSTLYSNAIFLRNVNSWQYYLGLFTVPNVNKTAVINAITQRHSAEESEYLSRILNRMNVKSLLELSRDTIRESLSQVCTDSRQLLYKLDSLNLPRRIRNLIQCKVPVNL